MGLGKLFQSAKKIPVLAYHADEAESGWQKQLIAQWQSLKNEGIQCLSLDDFLAIARAEKAAPDKAFLLTLDGVSQLAELRQLLSDMDWSATAFVSAEALLAADLKSLFGGDRPVLQLAMGGYYRDDYAALPLADAMGNLRSMVAAFDQAGIAYQKVMAYPKGNIPKSRNDLILLKALMADTGIEAAFKLDGKPERVPSIDFYEISRIAVSATDALNLSKIK